MPLVVDRRDGAGVGRYANIEPNLLGVRLSFLIGYILTNGKID